MLEKLTNSFKRQFLKGDGEKRTKLHQRNRLQKPTNGTGTHKPETAAGRRKRPAAEEVQPAGSELRKATGV